jgi:hypothetical protein
MGTTFINKMLPVANKMFDWGMIPLIVSSNGALARAMHAPILKRKQMENNVESGVRYPDVDHSLGEEPHPIERALARQMADAIEESIRAQYQAGRARRDAHPKAHGTEFRVNATIANNLAKGIAFRSIPALTKPIGPFCNKRMGEINEEQNGQEILAAHRRVLPLYF